MKKILLFAAVLLSGFTSLAQVVTGLVADYNFNTCNGQDGVLPKAFGTTTNVSYVADRFANPGSAASFNGSSSTVSMGAPAKANVSTGITISAWIKLTNTTGQKAIVSKWIGSTASDQYLFMINGNKTFLAIGNPTASANGFSGTASLLANTWYHVIATWDTSGRHQTYVNGVLDLDVVNSTFDTINNLSSTALHIGSQNNSSRFFNGAIDDVQLFNRKLSPSEILDLYNAPNPIVNGLVSKYSFDTGGAVDEVSNNDAVGMGVNFGTDRFGNLYKALDVTVNSTYLNLFDSYDGFSTGTNGKISYSFWINFKTLNSAYQIILGKSADGGCSGNDRQFLFRVNASNKLEVSSYGTATAGNYALLQGNTALNAGQWYHVVLAYDNIISTNGGIDKYKLYLNNNQETLTQVGIAGNGLGTIGYVDASACIGIGAYLRSDGAICANAQRLDAYFDDFFIYNKVLNATEIDNLYNNITPSVGLNQITKSNSTIVFPNPFTTNITTNVSCNSTIEVISIDGKTIYQENVKTGEISLNTENWKNGMYIMKIKNEIGTSVHKLIKQ